jgi:hypothetical protein
MIFVFRRDGSPSDTRKDGTSGSIAYYEFPAPGIISFTQYNICILYYYNYIIIIIYYNILLYFII